MNVDINKHGEISTAFVLLFTCMCLAHTHTRTHTGTHIQVHALMHRQRNAHTKDFMTEFYRLAALT